MTASEPKRLGFSASPSRRRPLHHLQRRPQGRTLGSFTCMTSLQHLVQRKAVLFFKKSTSTMFYLHVNTLVCHSSIYNLSCFLRTQQVLCYTYTKTLQVVSLQHLLHLLSFLLYKKPTSTVLPIRKHSSVENYDCKNVYSTRVWYIFRLLKSFLTLLIEIAARRWQGMSQEGKTTHMTSNSI